jgi:NTE family protein
MTGGHSAAERRPTARLGMALGGGGARGLAHIGVWSVLEEAGIRPSLLAGSSAGSIVAALWASGVPVEEARELAHGFGRMTLLRPSWGLKGLLRFRPAKRLLARWLDGLRLEDLPIPCAVVCTDLISGEMVVLREGPVLEAVLASSAVPGVYAPRYWEDREALVDGGVVTNLPVGVTRSLGAEVAVGVDLGFVSSRRKSYRHAADVALRALDVMGKRLMWTEKADADVVLRPEVQHLSVRAWHRGGEFLEAGKREARARLDEVRRALEQGGRRSEPT